MSDQFHLIFIGFGGVARTLVELLFLSNTKFKRVTIIEPRDIKDEPTLKMLIVPFRVIQEEITSDNVFKVLNKITLNRNEKNVMIDLSYNVYFLPLIYFCNKNNINYINTSCERWPVEHENELKESEDDSKEEQGFGSSLYSRTLHNFHSIARSFIKEIDINTTIVFEHGMNPGLISHFVKKGIEKAFEKKQMIDKAIEEDDAERLFENPDEQDEESEAFYTGQLSVPQMASLLRLHTIHCSEIDTQISTVRATPSLFVNTWGPYSLYSEGVDPVQIGGIIEKGTKLDSTTSYIPMKRGVDMMMKSFVPDIGRGHEIVGMAISHGESETLARYLAISDCGNKISDRESKSPQVYYVYSPCEEAWRSLDFVKENNYNFLRSQHALRGFEIESGADAVGGLLLFKDPKYNLWAGTILDIEDCRQMGFKYSGPTTIQVAASLYAVLLGIFEGKIKKGLFFPEDLDSDYILEKAKPWLGKVVFDFVKYRGGNKFEDFVVKE